MCFCKALASGLRLGYLSAHADLVRRVELDTQATCLHTSGLSQMATYKLLRYWQSDGLRQHLRQTCRFYARRRDVMEALLKKHVSEHCAWEQPQGGMFAWLQVRGVEDTGELIMKRARDAKVLLLPGKVFFVDDRADKCDFVRAAFSIATEQEMEEGVKRFANILDAM